MKSLSGIKRRYRNIPATPNLYLNRNLPPNPELSPNPALLTNPPYIKTFNLYEILYVYVNLHIDYVVKLLFRTI